MVKSKQNSKQMGKEEIKMEKNLSNIQKEIQDSIDKAIEQLKGEQTAPSTILNLIYPTRLTLTEHYHKIPYDKAVKYKDQMELIDGAIEDLYGRKRFEDLSRWSGKGS